MADRTGIQWCDATFNPWIGCQKVSAGCDHCYAEAQMDHRLHRVEWGPRGTRKRTSASYWSAPIRWNAQARREGRRMRVFCASLADWLDNRVPDSWREDLAALIEVTSSLDWLLLTKRPENWDKHAPWHDDDVQPNVTIGVTIEDESALFRRANFLHGMAISGWRTFVSYEPALGPVDWVPWLNEGAIGQLIMGGESGPDARPFWVPWAREALDQCTRFSTPFFLKQMGSNVQDRNDAGFDGIESYEWPCVDRDRLEHDPQNTGYQGAPVRIRLRDRKGGDMSEWPEDLRVREFPNTKEDA